MDQHVPFRNSLQTHPQPTAARRALSLRTPRRNAILPETSPGPPLPFHDNEGLQHQRDARIQQMIAASSNFSTTHPRNAAELAVSLVGLVFPYDVRNMQRSLAALQSRMKDVEARVRGDEAATARVEQGLKALEAEMLTFRSLSNSTAGANAPPDIEARIKEAADAMLAKAAANANNINHALQAVRSAMGEINAERAQLHQQKLKLQVDTPRTHQKPNEDTPNTSQRPDEDDISTASEDEDDLDPRPMPRVANQGPSQSALATHNDGENSRENSRESLRGHVTREIILPTIVVDPKKTSGPARVNRSVRLPPASPNTHTATAASSRPTRNNKNSLLQPLKTPQPDTTAPSRSIERRLTKYAGITKEREPKPPSRRTIFTTYTKNTEARFQTKKPQTAREHKDFIWEYIDDMQDKDMSARVQEFLCQSFPDAVSKSKGRGKQYRKILITGELRWPEVLWAIKKMPVPDFLV